MAEKAQPVAPGRVLHITSLANPLVKEIRGLALAKNRKASRLFIAEGLKLVADAIDAGWGIRTLVHAARVANESLVERLSATARVRGADIVSVSEAVLEKITRRENPQAVLGVFEQRLVRTAEVKPGPTDVYVVLESIRDPGNLGTIIRTVDAVGATGVILVGDTVDPFSVEAVRATMGSVFHVPLARATHEEFEALRVRWTGTVVGTHLAATTDYRGADYRGPVLVVMGGEQAGLTPALAAACGLLVKIPMAGRADSLNLAVATGVMLFEVMRDRLKIDG
jgi:TrmH family RNA methyltransferase